MSSSSSSAVGGAGRPGAAAGAAAATDDVTAIPAGGDGRAESRDAGEPKATSVDRDASGAQASGEKETLIVKVAIGESRLLRITDSSHFLTRWAAASNVCAPFCETFRLHACTQWAMPLWGRPA